MRGIIILILLVLLMGLAGWITFGNNPGRATINIETEKIKRDTDTAIENTEIMMKSGARAISGNDAVNEQPVIIDPRTETSPAN